MPLQALEVFHCGRLDKGRDRIHSLGRRADSIILPVDGGPRRELLPRQHVKMISAYRKYFPTADKRPPTPRKPVWGGDREHPYVRESLSPRSALQSRDAQREQLLSPR